jgi:hypothetical protein
MDQIRVSDQSRPRPPVPSDDAGEDRALSSHAEERAAVNNYYLPGTLKDEIARFVKYYYNDRYHEALDILRPVDVYQRRARERLTERMRIKIETLRQRRKEYLRKPLTVNTQNRHLNHPQPSLSF